MTAARDRYEENLSAVPAGGLTRRRALARYPADVDEGRLQLDGIVGGVEQLDDLEGRLREVLGQQRSAAVALAALQASRISRCPSRPEPFTPGPW